jgi:hypothetical protein
MKTWYLILIVILLLICASSGAPAPDMTFEYSGVATYDGLPATMNLAITGTQVKGTLSKPGVCESNVRLTTTSLTLTGTVSGGSWEGDGSISGTWTGGDSVCGNQLTIADGYPQQGTFTITSDENTVQLLRTGAAPLPSGWTYDFGATGKVYTPSAALPPPVLGYTITSGVDDNYRFVDKKKAYSGTDKRVYFWVQIGPVYGGEKVKVIWKDPDGNEYYTSDYEVADPAESGYESWKDYSLYSYIEIAGWDPASKPGTWTAEMYFNGKYLLSDTFTITSSGSGILKGLSFVPSSPTTEDDIQFTLTVQNPPAKPSYSWDMGEEFFAGQPVAWTDVPSFTYGYSKPGTYHVTVAVRDKDNYSTILEKKSWDVGIS